MSGTTKNINNNDKLNENLILSAKTGKTASTLAKSNILKSSHSNNNIEKNIPQQQLGSKLQAPPPNQLRRSLLPSASTANHALQHHPAQLTQLQSVTAATTADAKFLGNQPNQLQTVATIHHHHSQQQQQSSETRAVTSKPAGTSSTPAVAGSATTLHQQQHQQQSQQHPLNGTSNTHSRRSLQHIQAQSAIQSSSNLKAPAHSIPPRYQPPPQPLNGGILKHFGNSGATTNGKLTHPPYFADAAPHLNLKYPPDIPQLVTVYLPDSSGKVQSNPSRFLQQRHPQHQLQQQQLPQQQRRSIPLTNGEQQQAQQQDMLKFVRKTDQDHPSPNASVVSSATGIPSAPGRLTAEQNRQLQSLINELRTLKEQNQRLLDDNQELRDLCCFLDDDRQKGRKLAREWQRFGRYTASVMRQEVAAYQSKLRQLDDKQQELITDNLELKELCLYLDEERAHIASHTLCANCGASTRNALRDDGDGSSSSTNAEETMSALRNYERQLPEMHLRTTLNDQTLQYVRSLERRIQQLEEERVTTTTPTANMLSQQQQQQQQAQQQSAQAQQDTLPEPIAGRPEAVVRALQVLEVREQLERDRLGNRTGNSTIDQMDDGEKALVREMCNVVWRKLEGNTNGPTALESL